MDAEVSCLLLVHVPVYQFGTIGTCVALELI